MRNQREAETDWDGGLMDEVGLGEAGPAEQGERVGQIHGEWVKSIYLSVASEEAAVAKTVGGLVSDSKS